MKLIGTSHLNRYFFLLVFSPIVGAGLTLILFLFSLDAYFANQRLILIQSFIVFIGELLPLILEIISRKLNATQGEEPSPSSQLKKKHFSKVKNTKYNITPSYPFFIIFIITVIDLGTSMFVYYLVTRYPENETRNEEIQIVKLFITVAYGYCMEKNNNPIHKHQFLSFILLFGGNIMVYVSDLHFKLNHLFYLLIAAVNAGRLLLEKWVLEKKHVSPYLYIFYQGLIGLCILTVLILLCTYVKAVRDIHKETFNDFAAFFRGGWMNVLYFFSDIVFVCVFNVMYVLINKYYNPNQLIVTTSLQNVLFLVVNLINGIQRNMILYLTGNVLILLGAVLYNEIVIFYCCGLEYNTRKEIAERASNDLLALDISSMEIEEEHEENTGLVRLTDESKEITSSISVLSDA